MKCNCEIVRDLLPLYLDGVTSISSNKIVEEHLSECGECSELLSKLKNTEAEKTVSTEKDFVISKHEKKIRKKVITAGSIISGIFMIPIIVCFIVNLATGAGLDWFFIVLAALLTAASLIIVPIFLPKNKGLWALGTFTASIVLLLGVCCIYAKGRWFFVAASATVFGLSMFFAPFVAKSRPVASVLKNKKGLAVMIADTVLYGLMMVSIGFYVNNFEYWGISVPVSLLFTALAWIIFLVVRYTFKSKLMKAGLVTGILGVLTFFAEYIVGKIIGSTVPLPSFEPFVWNYYTADGNVKWIIMISGLAICAVCGLIAFLKRRKRNEKNK